MKDKVIIVGLDTQHIADRIAAVMIRAHRQNGALVIVPSLPADPLANVKPITDFINANVRQPIDYSSPLPVPDRRDKAQKLER